ncbi:MAG: YraN family protein [Holosporaceae bacterium]|jgi:putative endonuclease|nr:YraN family protein [Holosporaceae bacterium]
MSEFGFNVNSTATKGYLGEFVAVCLLKIKGYKILARRYKTVCGEIDIIAKRGDIIVFVEVKSRKSADKCYNAITDKQLQRIRRTSEIFMRHNKKSANCFSRYDVILIADWKLPIHIENISI